jgi:hypothetical protein
MVSLGVERRIHIDELRPREAPGRNFVKQII